MQKISWVDGWKVTTEWNVKKYSKNLLIKKRGKGLVFGIEGIVEENDDGVHWDYVIKFELNNVNLTESIYSRMPPTAYITRKGFSTEEDAMDAVVEFAVHHGYKKADKE